MAGHPYNRAGAAAQPMIINLKLLRTVKHLNKKACILVLRFPFLFLQGGQKISPFYTP